MVGRVFKLNGSFNAEFLDDPQLYSCWASFEEKPAKFLAYPRGLTVGLVDGWVGNETFSTFLAILLLITSCGNNEETQIQAGKDVSEVTTVPKLFWRPTPFEKKLKGAVIVASLKGNVRVINLFQSNESEKNNAAPETLKAGEIVLQGSTIVSGKNSEVDLLFTNGTSAKIGPDSKLTISAIWQKSFQESEKKVSDIKEETSATRIDLDLEIGDLIVDVKKLKKESSFRVNSPLGVAGIRGTQFRIFSESEKVELSVLEGKVSFWDQSDREKEISNSEKLVFAINDKPTLKPLNQKEKQTIKRGITSLKKSTETYNLTNLVNMLGAKAKPTKVEDSNDRKSERFEKLGKEVLAFDDKVLKAWKTFRETGDEDHGILTREKYLDEIDNETRSFSGSDAINSNDYRKVRDAVRQLKQTWKGYSKEVENKLGFSYSENQSENETPSHATVFNGNFYKVFKPNSTKSNFNTMRDRCLKMGGHLAYIETPEEHNFIYNLIRSFGKITDLRKVHYAFIGGSDAKQEGQWRWLNGEKINWFNWGHNEPGNHKPELEDFLGIQMDGTWCDASLYFKNHKYLFVCEWEGN